MNGGSSVFLIGGTMLKLHVVALQDYDVRLGVKVAAP